VFMCSYNAGADILNKYQEQWSELHGGAEETARLSEDVDKLIGAMYDHCRHQDTVTNDLMTHLNTLPKLSQDVKLVVEKISGLEALFREVDKEVTELEETIEIQRLQELQLDERFNLALYKERKLGDLEQLKAKLSREHVQKVMEHEVRQSEVLRERQAAFQEAFEEEVKHFKTHGHIPKPASPTSTSPVKLEEVTIDADESALSSFLEDS